MAAGAPTESLEHRAVAIGIIQKLTKAGHTAYLAGGCVRDELLGLAPKDYDVATDATPDRVAHLFPRTRAVGKAFGVMLVTNHGVTVEVATFRAEGAYSDKRRPDEVRFSTPEEDAHRRDFTINALFIDPLDTAARPTGRVIDFVGGQADLGARIVRAVGDPDHRLAEDHLRALRAVRFTARLGFTLDPGTSAAIRRHAVELAGVSRERIGDELRRMLGHRNRGAAVALLQELALDGPTLTEPCDPDGPIPTISGLAPEASFTTALVAWAVDRTHMGFPMTPGGADAIVASRGALWRRALCLTNEEREAFGAILATLGVIESEWALLSVAARKRRAASPSFQSALQIVRARDLSRATSVERDVRTLAATPSGLAPAPIVTGDDLTRAGLRPGPKFGVWLDRLYDLQLEDTLRSVAEAIDLVREWERSDTSDG